MKGWGANEGPNAKNLAKAIPGIPIHHQEPGRNGHETAPLRGWPIEEFEQSFRTSKAAGSLGCCFHTGAAFDLTSKDAWDSLDPTEREVVAHVTEWLNESPPSISLPPAVTNGVVRLRRDRLQPPDRSLSPPTSAIHEGQLQTTMQKSVRRWAFVAIALGLLFAVAGSRLESSSAASSLDRQAAQQGTVLGAALLALGCVALAVGRRARQPTSTLADVAPADLDRSRLGPRAELFLVSFVALFVEVMLIRYAGSQIRVFSFYKNVPLIGCFLGLGLGCWQGRGRVRDVLTFLLWLVPLAAVLAASPMAVGPLLGKVGAISSAEHILGDVVPGAVTRWLAISNQLVMALFCVGALVAITSLFSLLGRLLGQALERVPRLTGYTLNIAGSLAGLVAFVTLSYLQTPPWVWFLVGLAPLSAWLPWGRQLAVGAALIAANAAVVWPSQGITVWSPYQKLVGHELRGPNGSVAPGDRPSFEVEISDVFYQVAVDLRPAAVARAGRNRFPHYDEIYASIPKPGAVLVVGAGTGNDVAAALRAGARRVDAVEIDPAIVAMGRAHHPERPYDDPRVNVIVDDARAAFQYLPPESYDVVVFGLLDSHTQLGVSSLRLDNYVFTRESFAAARRLLAPGGHFVVTAASFRPWFTQRMGALVSEAVGSPAQGSWEDNWVTFIGQPSPEAKRSTASSARSVVGIEVGSRHTEVAIPTDDWPYLYLPTREIPIAYRITLVAMVLASLAVLHRGGLRLGRVTAQHGHFLFLGAAFLLMEVHAVNRLALLFGTTWLVSAITIGLVLVLIMLANLTNAVAGRIPPVAVYAALFAALFVSYGVHAESALGHSFVTRATYGLVTLSPVYFAGLVFARSFRLAPAAGPAIGANMLGSVIGGWAEYSTMSIGVRGLVLIALGFYGASALCLAWYARSGAAVEGQVAESTSSAHDPIC